MCRLRRSGRARAHRRVVSSCRPPSEKESGVTLTIPATSGRSRSNSKRPQRLFAMTRSNLERRLPCCRRQPARWRRVGGVGRPCGVFGGRGGRPSMMSSIWSASMVSHSSSAEVITSTRILRATLYCSSMMRRISVHLLHGGFGHVRGLGDAAAGTLRLRSKQTGAQLVGHAVARDRRGRWRWRSSRSRRRRHLVHEDLFGDAATEQHGDGGHRRPCPL